MSDRERSRTVEDLAREKEMKTAGSETGRPDQARDLVEGMRAQALSYRSECVEQIRHLEQELKWWAGQKNTIEEFLAENQLTDRELPDENRPGRVIEVDRLSPPPNGWTGRV